MSERTGIYDPALPGGREEPRLARRGLIGFLSVGDGEFEGGDLKRIGKTIRGEAMRNRIIFYVMWSVLMLWSGCQRPVERMVKPDYDRPLPPGEPALRKITEAAEMPDFRAGCYDLTGIYEAIENSLNYLSKPSSKAFFPYGEITHEQAVASLKVFGEIVASGVRGEQLDQIIREQFDVYISVGCDNKGTVLFTGYYTPILDGSLSPTEQFCYPLYQQPEDLEKGANGEILGRRLASGELIPYPARVVLENSGMLKGKELIWLGDAFEAYIAHVQGSAKIRTPEGEMITVGYAANNGHEYKSIRDELIKDKKISAEDMSLAAMIAYFKQHKDEINRYTNRNPRYVFFREEPGEPRGSLNEPVTALRTIATDKTIFPRASLAFITTRLPQATGSRIVKQSYGGFCLDQDTGGAIRAPGRCDVYMGQGIVAGRKAGQTYEEGRLYYLFLKDRVR